MGNRCLVALISGLVSYVPVGRLVPFVSQPIGLSDPFPEEPHDGKHLGGGIMRSRESLGIGAWWFSYQHW